MRRTPLDFIFILCLGCAAIAACDSPTRGNDLWIPDYPPLTDPVYAVDPVELEMRAASYCAETDDVDAAAGFFLGRLPLKAIDDLCAGPAARERVGPLVGQLHLSGYFGGLWLKEMLSDSNPTSGSGSSPSAAIPDSGAGRAIELLANERLEVALGAGGADLLAASKDAVPALLAIYGYNLGYLRVLIEHSPHGADPPPGLLECKSFLDCTSSTVWLDILDQNRSVLTNLTSPPTDVWRDWKEAVSRIEESSAGSGRSVWEGILSGSTVRPDAYIPLLTLSAGYLMVGEAAVLVNMEAWAAADIEKARCGLLLDAGLQVWSTSYFLGLASLAPAGTFPRLKCPPR